MNPNIVLCVDDDTTVLNALRTLLIKTLGGGVTVEVAESGEEALEICAELQQDGDEISVVISDFIMPGIRGDELLVRIHEAHPRTVKIMLTGQSEVAGIKRAINEANLFRFIEKPFANSDLVMIAASALESYRQEEERLRHSAGLEPRKRDLESEVANRNAELIEVGRKLATLSSTDPLTGLGHRPHIDAILGDELNRMRRNGDAFSAIVLDVDHMRALNETHGRRVGDQVLVAIAGLLREGTREIDRVGRWNEEEFLVICPGTARDGALAAAEKLRLAIAGHDFAAGCRVTVSAGVATAHVGDSAEMIVARAEAALREAKDGGRNAVESET